MVAQISKDQLCVQLGSCLEYPSIDTWGILQTTVSQISPVSVEASNYLKNFLSKMKRMELEMQQEHYVKTFDLMSQCSLYLSVHLFGEESFKRAELMAGLKCAYEKHGALETAELPDHLAVVLKHKALLNEEEWSELVSMCILPACEIMIGKLEKIENPFALILKAIQVFLVETEKVHV